MCDIEKKYAVLLAYVQDVADRGGRFDTHPTMEHTPNVSKTHADYQNYLGRINLGMKEGAQFVLNQIERIEDDTYAKAVAHEKARRR